VKIVLLISVITVILINSVVLHVLARIINQLLITAARSQIVRLVQLLMFALNVKLGIL
jgi:hypothetical protein